MFARNNRGKMVFPGPTGGKKQCYQIWPLFYCTKLAGLVIKMAGFINSSLVIMIKLINGAMKQNEAKFQSHY